MKPFSRLEAMIADIVERPAWLLSSRRLHPLELTAALTRALEARALRLADRVLAPDSYTLRLHPDDFSSLGDAVPSLAIELGQYLGRTVRERDLSSSRPPTVVVVADPAIRSGRVEVDARFTQPDPPYTPATRSRRLPRESPSSATVPHPPGLPADGAVPRPWHSLPSLRVAGPSDRLVKDYPLRRLPALIGRGNTCTVMLVDPKVSREHARIERSGADFLVTDLESLNGTFLNGQPLQGSHPLRDGDELLIGHVRLQFSAEGNRRAASG